MTFRMSDFFIEGPSYGVEFETYFRIDCLGALALLSTLDSEAAQGTFSLNLMCATRVT